MNIYRHQFVAYCPNNSRPILYALEIEATEVIHVEHIVTACSLFESSYHEEIADSLVERFGGKQILRAHHHGVDIETRRAKDFGRLKERVIVGKNVYEVGVEIALPIGRITK